MNTSRDEIIAVALVEFARDGYAGTSLQAIADAAGLSKSAVLYHFASKQALLEASVVPAVDALGTLLDDIASAIDSPEARPGFIAGFVDLLFEHRLAVSVFVNHGRGLVDVPVIARAFGIIDRLGGYFASVGIGAEDKARFGIALAGSAYMLVAGDGHEGLHADEHELRRAITAVMTELLSPIRVLDRPTPPPE
ncbi:helix-turn-helix domain-containing protein [Galbitalea sp. SE-J8]|uniref:TetR/AcrR family transcriptional regulator n=1 Tax=Galbitalea sp. SE-J8 TaxID=3054952 RepID=UPI00259CD45B|nr:TetR/AcrR family transcriptional regulator [Galbitalea sp. SE-J8]MDM4762668.1 helix-turn-helix domain-containing protein [Galbitalea sp. SE-J8]